MSWQVVVVPEGKNDGKNEGGLIVRLSRGNIVEEVSRVGFIRRNSGNPDVSFDKQLKVELDRARLAADTMNTLPRGGLS